jgi:hypothetical protein
MAETSNDETHHQPTTLGTAHDAIPVLLAEYPSLPAVRHAIEELEAHGVDGDDLALVGGGSVAADRTTTNAVSDARFLSRVSTRVVLSAIGGGFLGALFGVLFTGGMMLVQDVSSPGWVLLLMTGWFAAGGSLLGAFSAVARTAGFSESLPTTFAAEPGSSLWLAVYRGPREEVRPTVAGTDPLEIIDDPSVVTSHPALARRVA